MARPILALLAAGWICLVAASPAAAQAERAATPRPRTTTVEVELLAGNDGGALHAQQWRSIFEKLDIQMIVRRGILEEKPEIKEKEVGTLRVVTAVGRLDRNGRIVFSDRAFATGDSAKLKEWLDDLKTYGAQGSPQGKPLWGLSKAQFEALYVALGELQEEELQGKTLEAAVAAVKLPANHPARWTTAAQERRQSLPEGATVRQRVAGFTKATALAIALNDRGFGVRPNRTPAGQIELAIEILDAKADHWPIGWPLQQQAPTALPGMFAMTNVQLDQVPLLDVLEAVDGLAEVPVLIDFAEIDRRHIDLDKLRVSHPLKKTTWSLALRAILVPQKLTREYWQDEAGRAFVWVTPTGKERPAAVKDVGGGRE